MIRYKLLTGGLLCQQDKWGIWWVVAIFARGRLWWVTEKVPVS
jgi:hypothetical protein